MTTTPTLCSSLPLISLFVAAMATAAAMDGDIRLVPQIAVGSSGFEPGFAVEVRTPGPQQFVVRPEMLISEDGDLGVGGALLVELSKSADMPSRQALAVGPRLVYHNADRRGWEGDMLATWGFDLSDGAANWRHSVGALAAGGVLHDPRNDELDLGLTVGIFYAFRL